MYNSYCFQPSAVIKLPSLKLAVVCSCCAAPAGGSGDGAGEGELPDPHGGGGGREQRRQCHRGLGEQTSGKDPPIHTVNLDLNLHLLSTDASFHSFPLSEWVLHPLGK